MRRAFAYWWLRVTRRHFCWDCDGYTLLKHSHVAHPHRPGRSR